MSHTRTSPSFALHNSQVIYTSLDLAREVQRITVDTSANVSEVSTKKPLLPKAIYVLLDIEVR